MAILSEGPCNAVEAAIQRILFSCGLLSLGFRAQRLLMYGGWCSCVNIINSKIASLLLKKKDHFRIVLNYVCKK